MSEPDDYLSRMVEELADHSDETFIGVMVGLLKQKDARGEHDSSYTRLLFHPHILTRLARVRREQPGLFQGRFAPVLRSRRDLFYPDVMAAIDGYVRIYDPFVFTDGAALLERSVQPVRWLVPGLIAEGLTILGGTPKSGKSYLAYALALGTAVYGKWVQHWIVEMGGVLFLSLEDDQDDTRLRLAELDPEVQLAPEQIRFVHGLDMVPSFEEGLISWLTEAIQQYTPRLVVIDPISYLYTMSKRGSSDLFQETRQMLFPLRWLGKSHQCAIVALDHRRKRSRDDTNLFDTLHGSIAKQAIADALLMVERDDEQITMGALVRRGKDATHTLTMTFEGGRCWLKYTGEASQTSSYSDFRQQIYTCLMQYRIPMTIKEIIAEIGLPTTRQIYNNVAQICLRGVKAKELEKTTRGAYVWATQEET